METKFNSQRCTTREQSERLLSMGLKPETADMVWKYRFSRAAECRLELLAHSPVLRSNCHFNIDKINVFGHKKPDGSIMSGDEYFDELFGKDIPAWSLHRLVFAITNNGIIITFIDNIVIVEKHQVFQKSYEFWDDVYDTICDAIEELIKEGYFNKEYLVE